jgi:hypothetical protein
VSSSCSCQRDPSNDTMESDVLTSDIVKIQVYTKHIIRRDNFKGVTLGESVRALSEIESMSLLEFRPVSVVLMAAILGIVSRKLYKHSEEGSTQELDRSIHFKIDLAPIPNHSFPQAVVVEVAMPVPDVFEGAAVDTPDPHSETSTLRDTDILEKSRTALEHIDLAPWQRLLGKVEKFNELMKDIAEVTLTLTSIFLNQ